MNRRFDGNPPGHGDEGAVPDERGVESDEAPLLEFGISGKMFGHLLPGGLQGRCQAAYLYSWRQRPHTGMLRRIEPIHENQLRAVRITERERGDLPEREALSVGTCDGRKRRPSQRRHIGMLPGLLVGRGEPRLCIGLNGVSAEPVHGGIRPAVQARLEFLKCRQVEVLPVCRL